jgi:hypothetical protein
MGRSACICPLASNAGQCRKPGKANLQHVCQSLFHSFASACAELLSHARSIGVVEKPDFAHARARVRYPLDKVLWKGGDFAFRGVSAQRGGQETRILLGALLSQKKNRTYAGVELRVAGTSNRTCAQDTFLALRLLWNYLGQSRFSARAVVKDYVATP